MDICVTSVCVTALFLNSASDLFSRLPNLYLCRTSDWMGGYVCFACSFKWNQCFFHSTSWEKRQLNFDIISALDQQNIFQHTCKVDWKQERRFCDWFYSPFAVFCTICLSESQSTLTIFWLEPRKMWKFLSSAFQSEDSQINANRLDVSFERNCSVWGDEQNAEILHARTQCVHQVLTRPTRLFTVLNSHLLMVWQSTGDIATQSMVSGLMRVSKQFFRVLAEGKQPFPIVFTGIGLEWSTQWIKSVSRQLDTKCAFMRTGLLLVTAGVFSCVLISHHGGFELFSERHKTKRNKKYKLECLFPVCRLLLRCFFCCMIRAKVVRLEHRHKSCIVKLPCHTIKVFL